MDVQGTAKVSDAPLSSKTVTPESLREDADCAPGHRLHESLLGAADEIERLRADLDWIARMGVSIREVPGVGRAVVDNLRPASSNLESAARKILENARDTCAAANHVIVHRQLIGEMREALRSPVETPADHCYTYALSLLNAWVNRFGRPEKFEPYSDLYGVLSQIDNVVTGLLSDDREMTGVSADDVRSLRLQWGVSCSHDDCPSCAALDRALMRLTGDLPPLKTPEPIQQMIEANLRNGPSSQDPVLAKAMSPPPYIDGSSGKATGDACP